MSYYSTIMKFLFRAQRLSAARVGGSQRGGSYQSVPFLMVAAPFAISALTKSESECEEAPR